MKSRTPPPIATIGLIHRGPRLTFAEALAMVKADPAAYTLEEAHDETCPYWRARRDDACNCSPTYRLWKGGPS